MSVGTSGLQQVAVSPYVECLDNFKNANHKSPGFPASRVYRTAFRSNQGTGRRVLT